MSKRALCCSVLQYVAACCSVLQSVRARKSDTSDAPATVRTEDAAPFQCPSVSVCVRRRPYLSIQKNPMSCQKEPPTMPKRAPHYVKKSPILCQKKPFRLCVCALRFNVLLFLCVCTIGPICRDKRIPCHVQKSPTSCSKEPHIM